MIRLSRILIPMLLIVSMSAIPKAATVPTPSEPPDGVKVISIHEANQLLYQKDVYVFDMRNERYFGKGHIPGAVSLPYEWTRKRTDYTYSAELDISKLPTDKNASIIFLGDGPEEWKAYYTSKAAKEAGYNNVMWFRDGYSTWLNKGYAVEH